MTHQATSDRPADFQESHSLVRTTLNLTARAARDLDDLGDATGLNRTDLINRAVRLLALLHPHLEAGTVAILQPDGRGDRVYVL